MRNPFYRLIYSFAFLVHVCFSQEESNDITSEEITEHIRYLSSDRLKGRAPGTPGSKNAIRYIEKQWKAAGVLPAGNKGFQQTFEFTSGISLSGYKRLRINESRKTFRVKKDFMPLGFSAVGSFSAPVVFAGYGFGVEDSVSWNDYKLSDPYHFLLLQPFFPRNEI